MNMNPYAKVDSPAIVVKLRSCAFSCIILFINYHEYTNHSNFVYFSNEQLTSPITAEMTMAAKAHCRKTHNDG